jgi:hypothetical protein
MVMVKGAILLVLEDLLKELRHDLRMAPLDDAASTAPITKLANILLSP